MTRVPSLHMWLEACRALDQMERLQRVFFTPEWGLVWRPPVDVFESVSDVIVDVALPGVAHEDIDIAIEEGNLIIRGERNPPCVGANVSVRRLELPYGRFECAVPLPAGIHTITQRAQADGCLKVTIRKGPAG